MLHFLHFLHLVLFINNLHSRHPMQYPALYPALKAKTAHILPLLATLLSDDTRLLLIDRRLFTLEFSREFEQGVAPNSRQKAL